MNKDKYRPYTWEYLKSCIYDGKLHGDCELYILERNDKSDIKYKKHKSKITNIVSYIKNKYDLDNKKIVFVKNPFPYDFVDGINHYILWSSNPLTSEEINNYLNAYFNKPKSKFKYEFTWFVNHVQNMSIPDIWHCQVFWRRYPKTSV